MEYQLAGPEQPSYGKYNTQVPMKTFAGQVEYADKNDVRRLAQWVQKLNNEVQHLASDHAGMMPSPSGPPAPPGPPVSPGQGKFFFDKRVNQCGIMTPTNGVNPEQVTKFYDSMGACQIQNSG